MEMVMVQIIEIITSTYLSELLFGTTTGTLIEVEGENIIQFLR